MNELPYSIVPDSSVIVDGKISEYLSQTTSNTDDIPNVTVPKAVVNELEAQANQKKTSGWAGLSELEQLNTLAEEGTVNLTFAGPEVSPSDIRGAQDGDIDALIRQLAQDTSATLVTSDAVQAAAGRAVGLDVEHLEPEVVSGSFAIESFFDETTMSVHLKTDTKPKSKGGELGDITYGPISDEPTPESQMDEWASEIEHVARSSPDSFVELSEPGMTIIQLRDYRIAIARPPFSDALEITAVRPIAKTTLDDYEMPDGLVERFTEQKRGVLLSGSPGAGKSTFAQAVGEYLDSTGVVVKTMEQPRDLQVGPDITQYTALNGQMEKTADSLLLVRPDYTIYDEVRKTSDFDVFSDMRLAGVGMIGVVHATRAIDALQRLVGRVELGLIPQIVDTVVYIEDGAVHTVYNVTTTVKIPEGMASEDLARPVIQVEDFESGRPVFEVYTFNRQVVTVSLDSDGDSNNEPYQQTAEGDELKADIHDAVKSAGGSSVEVTMTGERSAIVHVAKTSIAQVIGQGGTQITEIENKLNASIDVRVN